MVGYQRVFKRYEYKYILNAEQMQRVLDAIGPHMELDEYGHSSIRNIYYDTDSYRLIRRSIEKPCYKEKLRVRNYAHGEPEKEVFVEVKKKYESVVYKRRCEMTELEANRWLVERKRPDKESQIEREIEYFLDYYGDLKPKLFLSYDRDAYYARDGSDFRVTFDTNVRCREENLSFSHGNEGLPVLEEGKVLMEIKCSGGIPLWMVEILSKEQIYRTSFSKYGTAYRKYILPNQRRVKDGIIV